MSSEAQNVGEVYQITYNWIEEQEERLGQIQEDKEDDLFIINMSSDVCYNLENQQMISVNNVKLLMP